MTERLYDLENERLRAEITDLSVAFTAVRWNVMDGYDEQSPVIIERASWIRLRDAFRKTKRRV